MQKICKTFFQATNEYSCYTNWFVSCLIQKLALAGLIKQSSFGSVPIFKQLAAFENMLKRKWFTHLFWWSLKYNVIQYKIQNVLNYSSQRLKYKLYTEMYHYSKRSEEFAYTMLPNSSQTDATLVQHILPGLGRVTFSSFLHCKHTKELNETIMACIMVTVLKEGVHPKKKY